MGTASLAARTLLAVVFGAAALGKLFARAESQATFEEFGAGPRLSTVAAVLLAPIELCVAVLLMIVPTARWAALLAILLLTTFLIGIANALAQGRRPDCGCFGVLTPAPIGARTIVRNCLLLAAGAFVAVSGPGPAIDTWLASRDAATLAVLAALVAALAGIVLWALRSNRTRVTGVWSAKPASQSRPLGAPAPEFSLQDEAGQARTLASLSAGGNPLVLVFASSTCGSCLEVIAQVPRWQAIFQNRLRIAVIGLGKAEAARTTFSRYKAADLMVGADTELRGAYGVTGTPAAVAVAPDGTIASGPVAGKDAIEDLIRLTLRQFDPMNDAWSQTIHAA
jgi:protein-disulfide isomerase